MFKILTLLLLLAVVNCQVRKTPETEFILANILTKPPQNVTEAFLVTKTTPSILAPPLYSNNGDEENLPCFMEDSIDSAVGQCVSAYLCDENNTIIDDGSAVIGDTKVINIRSGEGPCPSNLDVCCLPREVQAATNTFKPPLQPPREGCGWRNPEGADMRTIVVADGETKFGEFPWMVAILKNQPDNENIGGGSLIALNVVLTAAHTARSGAQKIRAGEWDTLTTKETYPYQDRNVASIEIHPYFSGRNLHYDVALLFLSEPVTPAPNVGVVCLPPPQQRTPAGTLCFATGWGKDRFSKGGLNQTILKKVEVPVVERNYCQTTLRRTLLGRFFKLHTSFMCAGGEKGKDTCKGDGGSPLSCPISYEEGRYMQSGIVAWGIGCGNDELPGVYVDVSSMREWIDEQMVSKGLDTRSYTI